MNEKIIAKAKIRDANKILPIILYCIAGFILILGLIVTEFDIEYLFFDYGLAFLFLTAVTAGIATYFLLKKKSLPECVVTDKRVYYTFENYSMYIPNSMITGVTMGKFNSITISSSSNKITVFYVDNLDEFHDAIINNF